jgi:hypothetical protein
MAGLPKFVRGRLAQGPGGDEHPGADLLNAFCEDALRPAEREYLLAHLAACAQCREVLALLTPAEGPPRLESQPERRWLGLPKLRFPALRWAALTAAVTVVIGAALLYRPEPTQRARSDAEAPASATAQPVAKPQAAESSVASALPASPAPKGKKEAARKPDSHQSAPDTRAPSETMYAASSPAGQSQAQHAMAKLGTPHAVNPQSVHGPHANLQQENQSAQQAAPSAPPAAFASKMASAGIAADAARQSQARQEMARSAMSASGTGQQEASQKPEAGATSPPATSSASPAVAPSPGRIGSGASLGAAGGVAGPHSAERTKSIAVSWNISSDGQLLRQRTGEEPQIIRVADNVRFRAVASIRGEVWAGGPGGVLYSSSDNGATWNKVAFPSTQDIVAIAFRNSREATVTVAGGERYVTHDGGQSWQETKDF